MEPTRDLKLEELAELSQEELNMVRGIAVHVKRVPEYLCSGRVWIDYLKPNTLLYMRDGSSEALPGNQTKFDDFDAFVKKILGNYILGEPTINDKDDTCLINLTKPLDKETTISYIKALAERYELGVIGYKLEPSINLFYKAEFCEELPN